jgi:hypothetical protein
LIFRAWSTFLICRIDKLRVIVYNYNGFVYHIRALSKGGIPLDGLNGYVKAEVFAEQWNVSVRQVEALCQSGRIDGAVKFGNTWAIPIETKKPTRTGERKPGRVPRE